MKKKLKDVISKEFKALWGTDFSDDGIPVVKTNNMTYEGIFDMCEAERVTGDRRNSLYLRRD